MDEDILDRMRRLRDYFFTEHGVEPLAFIVGPNECLLLRNEIRERLGGIDISIKSGITYLGLPVQLSDISGITFEYPNNLVTKILPKPIPDTQGTKENK